MSITHQRDYELLKYLRQYIQLLHYRISKSIDIGQFCENKFAQKSCIYLKSSLKIHAYILKKFNAQ